MNKIILIILTLAFLIPIKAKSQRSRWKRTRYEVVAGIGSTGFMGELGGGAESSHFISDFDFSSQRYIVSAGMRYKILEPLAVKGSLYYGMISGNDNKAKDKYRLDRNLSFRSPIVELGGQLEYSIIKEPTTKRYSRRRNKFSLKTLLTVNTYVFAGVSGFYFNPKGKDDGEGGTGDWVKLQPLGTEGQGLVEGRDKYSRFGVSIPFGFGFKYAITRKLAVGLEYGARWTFTDYMDDVSTTYIDPDWLSSVNPQAARMADKSLKYDNPEDDPSPLGYGAGDQRGSPEYNDYYMYTQITIAYKLRTGRNGLPKF